MPRSHEEKGHARVLSCSTSDPKALHVRLFSIASVVFSVSVYLSVSFLCRFLSVCLFLHQHVPLIVTAALLKRNGCRRRERQESVYNALQKVDADASLVCIHDAARPLVTKAAVIKASPTATPCCSPFFLDSKGQHQS